MTDYLLRASATRPPEVNPRQSAWSYRDANDVLEALGRMSPNTLGVREAVLVTKEVIRTDSNLLLSGTALLAVCSETCDRFPWTTQRKEAALKKIKAVL